MFSVLIQNMNIKKSIKIETSLSKEAWYEPETPVLNCEV